jgi:hypothetical protein
MAHDVFVSYSQKDKSTADAVVARLEQDGSRCWIAPRDILPGTSWGDAIAEAIAASRVMVLVLSANSNRSRQVIREVERAVAGDVVILPFRIEPVDPTGAMAYFLGTEHWLDALTPPMERHIERLSRTVRLLLSSEPVPREELDRPPPAVTRARRRPWWTAGIVAGAATVLVAGFMGLRFMTGGGEAGTAAPGGSGTLDAGATATTMAAGTATAGPSSSVALEEVGRYRPLDLDPTDLDAPGPIAGFDIDGRWLAYANGIDGVTRMDIGDPANPRPMATYGVDAALGVAIAGDQLAAVGGELGTLRVAVFPVDGSGGGSIPIEADGVSTIYGIEATGGYVYLSSHDYVGIVDATLPAEPRMVFEWVPPGRTGNPATVFVAEGVGYFAAGWDGLYIFDVADPAAPALLGHWASPDWVIDVVVVEDLAYLTLGDSGVAGLDVSDAANPRLLGSITVPGFAGPLDISHGHAFVGWFGTTGPTGGVAVVDMTDPEAPVLVDTFGTFPSLGHIELAGDHLFASDESEGLVVFRITGLE